MALEYLEIYLKLECIFKTGLIILMLNMNNIVCPVCKTETLEFVTTKNKISYYVCPECQIEHAEYTALKSNKRYKLKDMLDNITKDNLHKEICL